MDPTVICDPVDETNPQLDGAASEKMAEENGEIGEDLGGGRPAKRQRNGDGEEGGGGEGEEDMRRVAEIVLVLSALGAMRGGGGRKPTEAEVNLMAEARAKLAKICEGFAPKDLVARDAVGTVIEDLGLNWKSKDQRLGFRGSRLSIKEKFSLAKRKMEDSKKFVAASAVYTSQTTQPSFGAGPESRGLSHTARMFPPDKPGNASFSAGGVPASSPLGHVSAAAPTSATYQPLTTEVRAPTSSYGLASSHLGRDSSALAFPKVEKVHLKSEGGSNGTSFVPQVQANASSNHPLVNAPTWSIQPHSTSLAKSAMENKVPSQPTKIEGTGYLGMPRAGAQSARDQAFRPSISQTLSANLPSVHQPAQGMKHVQPSSSFSNHNELAKIVQKLLQPKLPQHPTWTPPSREYMNKPLSCQICKLTVNEVETVVLCDACEKGFHLKCLETINQRGIPRGEWHCIRCIALSNGKPLPPKYGRVMRSVTPPKGPSNPAGSQSLSDKKVGMTEPNVNQEKITANGSSGIQSPAGSNTTSGNCVESASGSKILNAQKIQADIISSSELDMRKGTYDGAVPVNTTKSLGIGSGSPSVISAGERSTQKIHDFKLPIQEERSGSELKMQPFAVSSSTASNKLEDSKPSHDSEDVQAELSNSAEVRLKTSEDRPMVEGPEGMRGDNDGTSRSDAKQREQDVQANSVGNSEPDDGTSRQAGLFPNGLDNVQWIGNVLKVDNERTFYESCYINGVRYKLQDHALFCSSHDRLIPSKLQAMWEDIKTGSKWVIANKCYFLADLPEAVGCPCAPESNEVYESNQESTVMAGLIQGPCKVLPPTRFKEESERRSQLGTGETNELQPIYLCKWFFDEVKGSFQPVFS